jgi:hypothetical protein
VRERNKAESERHLTEVKREKEAGDAGRGLLRLWLHRGLNFVALTLLGMAAELHLRVAWWTARLRGRDGQTVRNKLRRLRRKGKRRIAKLMKWCGRRTWFGRGAVQPTRIEAKKGHGVKLANRESWYGGGWRAKQTEASLGAKRLVGRGAARTGHEGKRRYKSKGNKMVRRTWLRRTIAGALSYWASLLYSVAANSEQRLKLVATDWKRVAGGTRLTGWKRVASGTCLTIGADSDGEKARSGGHGGGRLGKAKRPGPRAGIAREEASVARGCRKIGLLLGLMIGSGGSLLGWRGIRVGEAGIPGPYTQGGASSSGKGARGSTWAETGHGRWEKSVAREVVGDSDIDVAFAELDAWLDDREAEQNLQGMEPGGWPCSIEEDTRGSWDKGNTGEGGSARPMSEEGEASSGFSGDRAERGEGWDAGEVGPGWSGDGGRESPWSWLPDGECAALLNQACEGGLGWTDPHEHAERWRQQELRDDLERELLELERMGPTSHRPRAEGSRGKWYKFEEPTIEEEAKEEKGSPGEPRVRIVREVGGRKPGEQSFGGGATVHRGEVGPRVARGVQGQGGKKRGKDYRPRGGKKKGNQEQVFISINTSGRPQLVDNLWKLGLRTTRTLVVMAQEHQTRAPGLGDLQKAAGDAGWKLKASAAARGEGGGASAGTALAIAKHIGCDGLEGGRGGVGRWSRGGKDIFSVGTGGCQRRRLMPVTLPLDLRGHVGEK